MSLTTNLLGQIVGKENTIPLHLLFVDLTEGDHLAALFIQQCLYWSRRTRDPEGWFYKTSEQWWAELRITEKQIRRIREVVHPLGIESARKGMPAKMYYRVNEDVFTEKISVFLSSDQTAEQETQFLPKGRTRPDQRSEHVLDQRAEQGLYIRTETTTEIKTETTSPLPPRGGGEGEPPYWQEWIAYRKQRKLTCTPITLKKQRALLDQLQQQGFDPSLVVEQSITNGWQGLFPLKSQNQQRHHQSGNRKPQSVQEANQNLLDTYADIARALGGNHES